MRLSKILQSIKTTTVAIYRGNRRHLMKTAESTHPEELEEELAVTIKQLSQDQDPVKLPDSSKSPAPRRSSRMSRPNPKYYSEEFTA